MSTLSQFFGGGGGAFLFPAELLIIGGGGNGGYTTSNPSGGGGAGQFRYFKLALQSNTPYIITVGAGGGNQSSLHTGSFYLISGGGGAGAGSGGSNGVAGGSAAGSGGGGSAGSGSNPTNGAAGTTTSFSSVSTSISSPLLEQNITAYSNAGGVGTSSSDSNSRRGGGGGGAGTVGGSANGPGQGYGGGQFSSITGSSVQYSIGGASTRGDFAYTPVNADPNTGNGGSGGALTNQAGGTGGSGILIIAYPDTYDVPAEIIGTYDQPTRSGFRVYRFTGSGSFKL